MELNAGYFQQNVFNTHLLHMLMRWHCFYQVIYFQILSCKCVLKFTVHTGKEKKPTHKFTVEGFI